MVVGLQWNSVLIDNLLTLNTRLEQYRVEVSTIFQLLIDLRHLLLLLTLELLDPLLVLTTETFCEPLATDDQVSIKLIDSSLIHRSVGLVIQAHETHKDLKLLLIHVGLWFEAPIVELLLELLKFIVYLVGKLQVEGRIHYD